MLILLLYPSAMQAKALVRWLSTLDEVEYFVGLTAMRRIGRVLAVVNVVLRVRWLSLCIRNLNISSHIVYLREHLVYSDEVLCSTLESLCFERCFLRHHR